MKTIDVRTIELPTLTELRDKITFIDFMMMHVIYLWFFYLFSFALKYLKLHRLRGRWKISFLDRHCSRTRAKRHKILRYRVWERACTDLRSSRSRRLMEFPTLFCFTRHQAPWIIRPSSRMRQRLKENTDNTVSDFNKDEVDADSLFLGAKGSIFFCFFLWVGNDTGNY